MELVCHLCRCKFEADPGAAEVRCPKCGGKVPAARLQEAAARAERLPPKVLACPECLRTLRVAASEGRASCPYCGTGIDPEAGERLARALEGLDVMVRQELLQGTPPAELVRRLAEREVSSERAWTFVDRHLSELPFERHKEWKESRPIRPPSLCDACGVAGALETHEADWGVDPEELKRYRDGWGGFEGAFSTKGHYTRHALYYLCNRCARSHRSPDFAGGYPARFGFRPEKFRRVKL